MCLFRSLVLHLHGNQKLEEETFKSFSLFKKRMDGLSPSQFQIVHMNNNPSVGDLLLINFPLHDIYIVEGTK